MITNKILPLTLNKISYKAKNKWLIKNISYKFEHGPRTIILGPNGAGKSLLLRLCHRIVEPSEGNIHWHGDNENSKRVYLKQAMVFQRPVMLRRSVKANVEYALSLHGYDKQQQSRRADEVLELTGLSHFGKLSARVLSYGEQQKLALARAWAINPQVLFLDEPTASLDPTATRGIEGLINAIHSAGTRIIMSTHDMSQAKRISDDILFIHQGKLIESGLSKNFFSCPKNKLARAFIEGELLW